MTGGMRSEGNCDRYEPSSVIRSGLHPTPSLILAGVTRETNPTHGETKLSRCLGEDLGSAYGRLIFHKIAFTPVLRIDCSGETRTRELAQNTTPRQDAPAGKFWAGNRSRPTRNMLPVHEGRRTLGGNHEG